MAACLTGLGVADLVEIVDALHAQADAVEGAEPERAAWRRDIADRIGDALDTLPVPQHTREEISA
jgi:hypothetical protein